MAAASRSSDETERPGADASQRGHATRWLRKRTVSTSLRGFTLVVTPPSLLGFTYLSVPAPIRVSERLGLRHRPSPSHAR